MGRVYSRAPRAAATGLGGLVPLALSVPLLSLAAATPSPCPCPDPTLCRSLTSAKAKVPLDGAGREVLAFARSDNYSGYDMSLVTTIAATEAPPSPEAVCAAHSHGVRIVMLSGAEVDFGNATARAELVSELLNQTGFFGLDGVNLDIERFTGDKAGLTAYVRELSAALKQRSPPGQLSFDLGISPAGQTAGYDHKALAESLDFIVPMACTSTTPPTHPPLGLPPPAC